MNNLLSKSDENSTSFQILKKKHKYNSCIHCAYYSAYQLSVYSLDKKFQTSYQGLCESMGRDKSGGSHEIIIKELTNAIKNYEIRDASKYKECMMNMKVLRGLADYSDSIITSVNADEAEKLLINVQKILKDKYIC